MSNLLTLHYYFQFRPDPDFNFSKITLGVALGLIIIGVVWEFYRRKMKDKIARKILRQYPAKLMRYGIIAGFLLVFREYGLPYLSMRIWWVVLLAFMAFNGIKLLLTYKKQYKERSERIKKSPKIDKYLPKKKR